MVCPIGHDPPVLAWRIARPAAGAGQGMDQGMDSVAMLTARPVRARIALVGAPEGGWRRGEAPDIAGDLSGFAVFHESVEEESHRRAWRADHGPEPCPWRGAGA